MAVGSVGGSAGTGAAGGVPSGPLVAGGPAVPSSLLLMQVPPWLARRSALVWTGDTQSESDASGWVAVQAAATAATDAATSNKRCCQQQQQQLLHQQQHQQRSTFRINATTAAAR